MVLQVSKSAVSKKRSRKQFESSHNDSTIDNSPAIRSSDEQNYREIIY